MGQGAGIDNPAGCLSGQRPGALCRHWHGGAAQHSSGSDLLALMQAAARCSQFACSVWPSENCFCPFVVGWGKKRCSCYHDRAGVKAFNSVCMSSSLPRLALQASTGKDLALGRPAGPRGTGQALILAPCSFAPDVSHLCYVIVITG